MAAHRRTRRLRTDEVGLERNIRGILRRRRSESGAEPAHGGPPHGELCFGCGMANVFGLQLEAERRADGTVHGRFFVKQDHQGPTGRAHPGVVAAALADVMSLCADVATTPTNLSVELPGEPPVGAFVTLTAQVERRSAGAVETTAEATCGGGPVASARAVFRV